MVGDQLRMWVRDARARSSRAVRLLDQLRALGTGDGRALLWTRFAHGRALHQTSGTTQAERYPELFDLAARLFPDARRVLSFGCSTGEEIEALRRRFPAAEIVGAEINPRSRRAARRRMHRDAATIVVGPDAISGSFDLIFALAVLQRLPERVARLGIEDLSSAYPFRRFDDAVAMLAGHLRAGGLLCVMNAHYRVEDSRSAELFHAIEESPPMSHPLFGRDSRRLAPDAMARSTFRKA